MTLIEIDGVNTHKLTVDKIQVFAGERSPEGYELVFFADNTFRSAILRHLACESGHRQLL
jgi:hypothetical protein